MKKRILRIFSLAMTLITFGGAVMNFSSCSARVELTAEVLPVKDGKDAIMTIVNDDGDIATAEYLQKEFEKNDLVGTFAMIADRVVDVNGNPSQNIDRWYAVMDSGRFEMANHTQTHVWYGFTDQDESGTFVKNTGAVVQYSYKAGHMTNEIVGAAERIREVFKAYDQRVLCYVIPGFTNAPGYDGRTENAKKIISDNFICSRNTGGAGTFGDKSVPCLNNIDKINYESLNCMMVRANDDYETRWFDYVDDTIENHGWGIYCFHFIVDTEGTNLNNVAKYKASELFNYIGDKVEDGSLWCANLTDATLYTKEYENAKVQFTQEKDSVTVSLRCKLDKEIYNMPLTVKVGVYPKWKNVAVTYDGKTETLPVKLDENGGSYVLVDMVPGSGQAVITKAK